MLLNAMQGRGLLLAAACCRALAPQPAAPQLRRCARHTVYSVDICKDHLFIPSQGSSDAASSPPCLVVLLKERQAAATSSGPILPAGIKPAQPGPLLPARYVLSAAPAAAVTAATHEISHTQYLKGRAL
jgi:hypothetical protein